LSVDQLVDLGAAIAGIVALGAAGEILIEFDTLAMLVPSGILRTPPDFCAKAGSLANRPPSAPHATNKLRSFAFICLRPSRRVGSPAPFTGLSSAREGYLSSQRLAGVPCRLPDEWLGLKSLRRQSWAAMDRSRIRHRPFSLTAGNASSCPVLRDGTQDRLRGWQAAMALRVRYLGGLENFVPVVRHIS
jgi:hypothetical protein